MREPPSIAQCLNRVSSVHVRILRGEKFNSNSRADARGWSTACATLRGFVHLWR